MKGKLERLREERRARILTIDEKYIMRIAEKYVRNLPEGCVMDYAYWDAQRGAMCVKVLNEDFGQTAPGCMYEHFDAVVVDIEEPGAQAQPADVEEARPPLPGERAAMEECCICKKTTDCVYAYKDEERNEGPYWYCDVCYGQPQRTIDSVGDGDCHACGKQKECHKDVKKCPGFEWVF